MKADKLVGYRARHPELSEFWLAIGPFGAGTVEDGGFTMLLRRRYETPLIAYFLSTPASLVTCGTSRRRPRTRHREDLLSSVAHDARSLTLQRLPIVRLACIIDELDLLLDPPRQVPQVIAPIIGSTLARVVPVSVFERFEVLEVAPRCCA